MSKRICPRCGAENDEMSNAHTEACHKAAAKNRRKALKKLALRPVLISDLEESAQIKIALRRGVLKEIDC